MDISMEDLFMFYAILIGILVIMWIFVAAVKKKQDAENRAQPVRKKKAKIIDMQKVESGAIVFGEPWVLFELENGSRVRLNAKAENSLMVGDAGLLTWQGKKILKFEREY